MPSLRRVRESPLLSLSLAARAIRMWTRRQVVVAAGATVAVATVIGLATVLIPNPIFSREIAAVPWNYPVWIVTAVLAGMLTATYVRSGDQAGSRRNSRLGIAGTVLAWFAVGCPVCNKLALLALGYSGTLTWFAPAQPILAAAAILLSGAALVWRLQGQVACATVPAGR